MEQCKYVFVRGPKRGEQCEGKASTNSFCENCRMKPNAKLQFEQGYIKPWSTPKVSDPARIVINSDPTTGISIADTSKLQFACTLRELCQRVPAKDLLEANKDCCEHMKMEDFSLDLTAAAKYIAQLQPRYPSSGFECRICVIDKHAVGCQYGMFSIPLFEAGPWEEVSTFMIKINRTVTEAEALAAIIWQLTCKGWPEEFIEWLDIKDRTREETNYILKQKLGL